MRSLATKLLFSIGIATIFYSIFLLYQTYSLTNGRVREVVEQQASMALKFDVAIRKYIAENVRPVMYELLGKEAFMPETMSTSYVARTIFEDVQKEFPHYIIKFASDNPRNPLNQAGPEELKIIEYFNNNPQSQRWEGKIPMNGKPYFAAFSPMRMDESCLRCHGDPKDAPASLLKRYGSTAGFHRSLGQVIGMDTIAIPIVKIAEQLWSQSIQTFFVGGLGLLLFFLAIVFITRFIITNRLTMISRHFVNAAQEEDYSKINSIEIKGRDEIFDLALSFNTLSDKIKGFYSSLDRQVKERTRELSDKNVQLQLEIEARKEAAKMLRENEKRFLDITHSMADWVWEVDKNGKYTYVSDTVKNILGYSSEELIGRTPFEIMPEEEAIKISEIFLQIVSKSGPIVDLENWNLTKDGSEVCLLTNGVPIINDDGELKGYRGVDKDISIQKKLEAERLKIEFQLRQAQKMEAIGTLAGGIAHDFNNILSSVIGFTELALEDVEKGTQLEDHLQDVFKAGKRAKNLVKQILTFARQADAELKPIKVSTIAEEALKLIRSTIPTTIEIRQNIGSDSLIVGNVTQMHQIFMNLCTNAAQAMETDGGILEVSLKDVTIDRNATMPELALKPGNYLTVTTSDTGTGIPPDIISSIFEPYFTTKGIGEGTGMGLAMVHGIVKSWDGEITVESKVGKGTVFTVYFPIIQSGLEAKPYTKEKLSSGTERILFVDDELSIAKSSSLILKGLGYKVATRTSSIEALELFRSKPNDFDLVITDMTMPNMTGDRLASELIRIRADIPVILCSGYSRKTSDDSTTAIGIKAFAYKPIFKADLAKIVRKVLNGEIEK